MIKRVTPLSSAQHQLCSRLCQSLPPHPTFAGCTFTWPGLGLSLTPMLHAQRHKSYAKPEHSNWLTRKKFNCHHAIIVWCWMRRFRRYQESQRRIMYRGVLHKHPTTEQVCKGPCSPECTSQGSSQPYSAIEHCNLCYTPMTIYTIMTAHTVAPNETVRALCLRSRPKRAGGSASAPSLGEPGASQLHKSGAMLPQPIPTVLYHTQLRHRWRRRLSGHWWASWGCQRCSAGSPGWHRRQAPTAHLPCTSPFPYPS